LSQSVTAEPGGDAPTTTKRPFATYAQPISTVVQPIRE
jgi:hypothetical protein